MVPFISDAVRRLMIITRELKLPFPGLTQLGLSSHIHVHYYDTVKKLYSPLHNYQ